MLALSAVISAAIFFAVPILSALAVHKPPPEFQNARTISSPEMEPPKHEIHPPVHKEIRQIAREAKAFKPTRAVGPQSQGFHMDLSLATGSDGDGGVGVAGGGKGAGSGFGIGGGGGLGVAVFDPSEVDQEARVLKDAQPDYPVRARKDGVKGYVKFFLVIDAHGQISELKLLSVEPAGYGFEIEAEKAVRQFRFEPAQLRGVPVAQKATKEFVFDLGY
ncbi:MAG TPA: energy transducer TonB [Fibrobacteraceae bacterium]|nr:energy transducer TonB [Fibrobacteraceae bacterium]